MHLGVEAFVPLVCSPLQGFKRQGQKPLGMHRKFPSDRQLPTTPQPAPKGGGSDTSQTVQESRVIRGEACMKSLGGVMGTFVVFSPPTFPTWIRTIDLPPTQGTWD